MASETPTPATGTGTPCIGARLIHAACTSTPTGAGLIEGANHLAKMTEAGRQQYILLVTDGADWDKTCPTPDPLQVTKDNAKKGIKTFILGFSADGTLSAGGVGVHGASSSMNQSKPCSLSVPSSCGVIGADQVAPSSCEWATRMP